MLATTLFYVGFSKQLFSEMQFQYESDGVIYENEPVDILHRWQFLLTPKQQQDKAFMVTKRLEMAIRKHEKTISVFEHAGPHFRLDTQDGYRHYRLVREKQVQREVNAWLQLVGVLLFSAGIMGFVLERRLFKIP